MVKNYFSFLAFLFCFVGTLVFRPLIHVPVRAPAENGIFEPTQTDIAAAKPSDILLFGSQREEKNSKLFLSLWDGGNSFGLRALEGESVSRADDEVRGKENVNQFLGNAERVSFVSHMRVEGKSTDLLLQIYRDPSDIVFGVKARMLETRVDDQGLVYVMPGKCTNLLRRYHSYNGALEILHNFPDTIRHRHYSNLIVEFPLRNESRVGGRHFAWNTDENDYQVIGSVPWIRLSPAEDQVLEQSWRNGWKNADESHRTYFFCTGEDGWQGNEKDPL